MDYTDLISGLREADDLLLVHCAAVIEGLVKRHTADAERLDKLEKSIRGGFYLSELNEILRVCRNSYASRGVTNIRAAIDSVLTGEKNDSRKST